MESGKKQRKISALDMVTVLFVILCIAASGFRLTVDIFGGIGDKTRDEGTYAVAYKVSSIRTTSTAYFSDGTEFYLGDDEIFGVAEGSITVTPAEYYVENDDGTLSLMYSPENGDETLVDIKGTMTVDGAYSTESGLFLLNGETVLAPNAEIEVYSGEIKVTLRILSITKAE